MGPAMETALWSCILRVESPRRQWYHQRLQAWVHLVPIRVRTSAILGSNSRGVETTVKECATIAAAGRVLAEQVVNEIENDLLNAGVRYAQAWM